ncbi:MAG TPA: hypothetical protein VFS05_09580 [Gemmatimonadaceae bacterium]|nr:hypothetical protein [Gemmatimonadaceae bacterium]
MRHLVLGLAVLASLSTPAAAQHAATSPATDSLFELRSEFWASLHHFLYHQARARLGTPDTRRRAVAGAAGDTVGFGALPERVRADWTSAVAAYERSVASRDLLFDADMRRINDRLAALPADGDPTRAGLDSAVAATLLRAAPAYRALWWERHDRANRRTIAALTPLVRAHGETLARRLTELYRVRWPAPLRVDVVPYASWAGAYTTTGPAHITFGSLDPGNAGTQGLEILFHEASHALGDSVLAGIRGAAAAEGASPPRDLLHAIIFFTAGELVRRELPGHVPYAEANGLWTRVLAPYRGPLADAWLPYLDGRIGMEEALRRLVTALEGDR